MRKESLRIVAALALFVLCACAGAHAQTVTRMRADIPFDFQVGQQSFRAGLYFVDRVGRQTAQESLRISSADGKTSALVSTSPMLDANGARGASLVFHRYGDMSFLRQVRGVEDDLSLGLQESRAERRLERELKVGAKSGGDDSTMAESAGAHQTVAIPLRRR